MKGLPFIVETDYIESAKGASRNENPDREFPGGHEYEKTRNSWRQRRLKR